MFESSPKRTLAASLRRLVEARKTGTMFVTTNSKHCAILGLEDGRLASILYEELHGVDALDRLQHEPINRSRFSPMLFRSLSDKENLPPTNDLLETIEGWSQPSVNAVSTQASGVEPQQFGAGNSERQAATTAQPEASEAAVDLTFTSMLTAVGRESARYFGPIGPILCAKKLQAIDPKDSGELKLAIQQIAADLKDESLGKEFEAKAIALVEGLSHKLVEKDERNSTFRHHADGTEEEGFEPVVNKSSADDLPVDKLLAVVSNEFSDYYGPVGSLLCAEHFKALPPTDTNKFETVVKGIAAELKDDRLGNEFVYRAMERSRRLLAPPQPAH